MTFKVRKEKSDFAFGDKHFNDCAITQEIFSNYHVESTRFISF